MRMLCATITKLRHGQKMILGIIWAMQCSDEQAMAVSELAIMWQSIQGTEWLIVLGV